MMRENSKKFLFWALMFVGAFLLLTQVEYSDGDDAFFYHYTHQMGFLEYLSWRYQTWVGRMSGEAMVYLTFSLGIWFWRAVNALMLVLLPYGVLRLAEKAAQVRTDQFLPGASMAAVSAYLLMSVMTVGYAAVWVNGSIFYTWAFTCGVWALMPIADLIFCTGEGSIKQFFYALPAAVLASMSIEQMSAVLLTFELLAVCVVLVRNSGRGGWRKRLVGGYSKNCTVRQAAERKKMERLLFLQTAVTAAAVVVLLLAPGNALRVAQETQNWMPQFESLSLPHHLFLTAQWMLSSFANENRWFLCSIWMGGILYLVCKRKRKVGDFFMAVAAAVCLLGAVLPVFGIDFFADCGLSVADITVRLEEVMRMEQMQPSNWLAMLFWTVAVLFTGLFVWWVSDGMAVLVLAYLGGIASEAIMYGSPTMYASGARVFYLTDWMWMFVILVLAFRIPDKKCKDTYYAVVTGIGVFHLLSQVLNFVIAG